MNEVMHIPSQAYSGVCPVIDLVVVLKLKYLF